MKKYIIIGFLALALVVPVSTFAQTPTQQEVNQQLLALINDLMKQVLALMEQLKKVEADQAVNTQTLTTIQTQTAPVLGAVSQPSLSATVGKPFCDNGEPTLPISFDGQWEWGLVRIQPSVQNTIGGRAFQNRQSNPYLFGIKDNWGSTTIVISLDSKEFMFANHEVPAKFSTVQTIYIGDVCQ